MQRTGQLMYELSILYPDISGMQPAYGWSVHYARTAEGLPYIGPHRNFPHQLFAFGDSSHSVTGAYLASRILLRHHLGETRLGGRGVRIHALMAVDLLVFGPHPDDLEIGLGGTIARHAALGPARRPVRPDRRRDGQQRHRRGAAGRGRGGARGARRGVAREPALARSPDRQAIRHISTQAVAFIRRHRPRVVAVPYWSDRHPDHVAASARADRGGVQRRPAPLPGGQASAWKAEWICYYFINDARRRRSSSTCRTHYEHKRQRARLPRQPVPAAADPDAVGDAPEHAAVPAADREPRRAVRRARRRHLGRRRRRARADRAADPAESTPMNIGIVCYASVGGSGIVATELGKALAARGHHVHVLSSDTPFRLGDYQPGPVVPPRRDAELSAVPRAAVPAVAGQQDRPGVARASGSTSSTRTTPCRTRPRPTWRARFSPRRNGGPVPTVITTLHGTDITLVGSDRRTRRSSRSRIEQSDGVTAVSESLKADTYRELGVTRDIRVIPNFLDCDVASPQRRARSCARSLRAARREARRSTSRTSGR